MFSISNGDKLAPKPAANLIFVKSFKASEYSSLLVIMFSKCSTNGLDTYVFVPSGFSTTKLEYESDDIPDLLPR